VVEVRSSTAVLIKGFTIIPLESDIEAGIYIWYDSYDCTVMDNVIANFSETVSYQRNMYGIRLDGNYCKILGNTFINDGMIVSDSYQNEIENNVVNGKPLVYLEGNSSVTVSDAGQIILVNCNDIQVENLHLSSTSVGVELWKTNNTRIVGNNITANTLGVVLYYSSSNSIVGNNIIYNGEGVMPSRSSNNSIVGNNITENYYEGVFLSYTSNDNILENNISNNSYGLCLFYSSGNNIIGNNMTKNLYYGVELYWSSNNYVYHNNFVNNVYQAYVYESANVWDDGYPSGGNCWSNYAGADLYSGPNQNETGSDGIGDTPYIINGNIRDNFPLMKPYPWAPHDVGITSVTTSKTVVGQGYNVSINVMVFNYGNYTEELTLEVYANTTLLHAQPLILTNRTSSTLSFTWETTTVAKGNYTINAVIVPVPDEADTTDNNWTDSRILVTKVGDLGGSLPPQFFKCDGKVDGKDLALFLQCFKGTAQPEAMYIGDLGGGLPPSFFQCDGKVDGKDLALFLQCFKGLGPP